VVREHPASVRRLAAPRIRCDRERAPGTRLAVGAASACGAPRRPLPGGATRARAVGTQLYADPAHRAGVVQRPSSRRRARTSANPWAVWPLP